MRTPLILSALGLMLVSPAFAEQGPIKKKGEKPAASPGWVVIEEDFFYPMRFAPLETFHEVKRHYRSNEEKAAANEITKAASWLKFAAGHAYPETQKDLNQAAAELTTLAKDLREGNTAAAARMDATIAKAEHALATWHYFKAKQSLSNDELKWAAQDLQAAANYLKNAADSAHYEFGGDQVTFFDDLNKEGNLITEGVITSKLSTLEQHLQAVNTQLTKLAAVLNKDASGF